ncbi:NAD(P)/FAD-dependent oxidoreductase [Rothia uropygialis]|uniref:NAD(P)/FAD-dependent oxidoreductase n=1 Tax=Kocuria sp. 36 TaxID=1415402 RepID=UPI0013ECA363|nr:NAD(P)/FAD-dependent oxidoreductase [Kocuria sp. 36]
MKNVLIIGYGIAGITAADTLRHEGYTGQITIVGEESTAPYTRPGLSKSALSPTRNATINHLALPNAEHGGTEMLGMCAKAMDPQNREVTLEDGTRLPFDGLVIATGARPQRFSKSSRELNLRTFEEASRLRDRLLSKPRLTIIGGGPLGMEIASVARSFGAQVTLIHRGTPMRSHIGPFLANHIASRAIARGIDLLDDRASEVLTPNRDSDPLGLVLESGNGRETDLVITAIGDKPSTEWLESSGLLRQGRLVTDENGSVAPGIVAAGDATWQNTDTGYIRTPLWTTAIAQAKAAATTLLHGSAKKVHTPTYFWTEQFDVTLRLMGPAPSDTRPDVVAGSIDDDSALFQWPEAGTAAAWNFKIPIPKLRRLARPETLAVR